MSKLKIIYWALIGVIVFLSVWGLVQSCNRPKKEQILKQQIQYNEDSIKKIKAKRDSTNAVRIPFSDRGRDSVLRSINRKTGFGLYLRH